MSVQECPSLGEGFLEHDTGETPLPVNFKYPSEMKGNFEYISPDDWEGTNGLFGRIHRGETKNGEDVREGDGDVALGVQVRYRGLSASGRDGWWEGKGANLEEFTSVNFRDDHPPVKFGLSSGLGNSDEADNGWAALGWLPFSDSRSEKNWYFKATVRVGVSLLMTDYDDVTAECGKMQREALKRIVESIEPNTKTTFNDYTDVPLEITAK